jgi:hypothetical protein
MKVVGSVLLRPSLWGIALKQLFRLAQPGWWRHAPFLPLPPSDYLAFRMVTQYGSPDAAMSPDDVISYLQWCRGWDSRA